MLGCGVVGSQVARLLLDQSDDLAARIGAPLELVGIAVRRLDRARTVDIPRRLFTTDASALVTRPDVDVVIEVIGGIEPARGLILAALGAGASVVTANKALLAEDGATVFEAAEKAGRDVYFEAAVAGAIPIIRPLRESLAGDRVRRVLGIVNGTTNFILDSMDTSGRGRRRVRRRRQGRHSRVAGLPHARHGVRRASRGHLRRHSGRHRCRAPNGLGRQAAGDL
jgi:homoserine dehydrogenase